MKLLAQVKVVEGRRGGQNNREGVIGGVGAVLQHVEKQVDGRLRE